MQITATLQAKIDEYLKENAAKRAELIAIMEPYKRLIAEIEADEKELIQAREMITGNYGQSIKPLYWVRSKMNFWRTEDVQRIAYRLQYTTSTSRGGAKTASVWIESRPELKKYKYTVTTHSIISKSINGKTISVFESNFNDSLSDMERKRWNYRTTSEASADEKKLMVEHWNCKTLAEAEAKAKELIQAVNNVLRSTKYYKKLVSMVSTEIDKLEVIEEKEY